VPLAVLLGLLAAEPEAVAEGLADPPGGAPAEIEPALSDRESGSSFMTCFHSFLAAGSSWTRPQRGSLCGTSYGALGSVMKRMFDTSVCRSWPARSTSFLTEASSGLAVIESVSALANFATLIGLARTCADSAWLISAEMNACWRFIRPVSLLSST
jgi:hypothetical protein